MCGAGAVRTGWPKGKGARPALHLGPGRGRWSWVGGGVLMIKTRTTVPCMGYERTIADESVRKDFQISLTGVKLELQSYRAWSSS